MVLFYEDGSGRDVFVSEAGRGFRGRQMVQETDRGKRYDDIWELDNESPDEVEVGHGMVQVIWERFTSSFSGYLANVGGIKYMKRSGLGSGPKTPFTMLHQDLPFVISYRWS